MNKEQGFSILEQALNVANQKGVFLLADAAVIQTALAVTREALEIPLPEMVTPVDPGLEERPAEDAAKDVVELEPVKE